MRAIETENGDSEFLCTKVVGARKNGMRCKTCTNREKKGRFRKVPRASKFEGRDRGCGYES